MPNSLVWLICHSPVPWQLAPQWNDANSKSSNYLQLSLSAYIASGCVLTRLLYQCSEKPDLKQHPSCWGCRGHLGNYTGSNALRTALYLGAVLLCMGKVGEGRVVHELDCDGDNSTQLSFIIYLYHCQIHVLQENFSMLGKNVQRNHLSVSR